MIESIKKNKYIKSVLTITGGTIFAHLIVFLSSPILTRIYTAEEYGLFSVVLNIASVLGTVICLRLEQAIMMETNIDECKSLAKVSLYSTVTIAIFTSIIIFFLGEQLTLILKDQGINSWLISVPILLLVNGINTVGSYYLIRMDRNGEALGIKIGIAVMVTIFSLTLHFLLDGGLIIGCIAGTAIISFYVLLRVGIEVDLKTKITFAEIIHKIKKYRQFLIFGVPSSLINSITSAAPIFLISKYFGNIEAGYYGLAIRVLIGPVGILAAAISQVNLRKISDLKVENKKINKYINKMTLYLGLIILPIPLIVTLYGTDIFCYIFGSNWKMAGDFAEILAISVLIRFVASTLSSTFDAIGDLKIASIWQYFYFLVFVFLYSKIEIIGSSIDLVFALTIIDSAMYIIYYLMLRFSVYVHDLKCQDI